MAFYELKERIYLKFNIKENNAVCSMQVSTVNNINREKILKSHFYYVQFEKQM